MEPKPVPTLDELHIVYERGETAVITLVEEQTQYIQVLAEPARVLEDQIAKNTQNSSNPPSSGG